MITNENKVERDLAAWRKQEEQIIKLFPPSVVNSREFRLEKLERLDAIYYKHARGGTHEERIMLRMLNIEREKLEKQLFPWWQRLMRAVLAIPKMNAARKLDMYHRASGEQNLRDTLSKTGFNNINWQQLEQKMQQGQGNFTIAHSTQVNPDKRIDYDLSFSKDQYGRYRLDHYQAMLRSDAHSEQNKKQVFVVDNAHQTTSTQAFNLLEGRAVEQEYRNALGGRQTAWVKLDFNDKDNAGSFKRREFHSHIDLEKTLEALPIREKANHADMEKLLNNLRNGERAPVTLLKEGKEIQVSVEANPQLKTVDLYNANGKKVGLQEALGEKKEKAPVVSLNQSVEEKQQRKTGIAMNQ